MELFSAREFRQVWIAFFILGAIFINRPFLEIFNHENIIFGIPLSYAYFFIGWLASIAVIFVFRRLMGAGEKK